VVSAEMLTPEPVAAGSEFKVIVRSLGRDLPFVYRISTFDRPRVVKLVADSGLLRSEDTITVEREGEGSSVTYDARLTAKGVARLANPLLAAALRRIGDAAASSSMARWRSRSSAATRGSGIPPVAVCSIGRHLTESTVESFW
jgi:hypothetical protein